MKKKILVAVATVMALTAVSCGSKNGGNADSINDSQTVAVDTAVAESTDSVAAQQAAAEAEFAAQEETVRKLYADAVFGDSQSAIRKLCTAKMQKKLKSLNEYDDGGYAVWCLRSENQDGDGPSKVESVERSGENEVIVNFTDMGSTGHKLLYLVKEGDTWKVDDFK